MNENMIAVIGAGTMGQGIAQLAAESGFNVQMIDVSATALEQGLDEPSAVRKSHRPMQARPCLVCLRQMTSSKLVRPAL